MGCYSGNNIKFSSQCFIFLIFIKLWSWNYFFSLHYYFFIILFFVLVCLAFIRVLFVSFPAPLLISGGGILGGGSCTNSKSHNLVCTEQVAYLKPTTRGYQLFRSNNYYVPQSSSISKSHNSVWLDSFGFIKKKGGSVSDLAGLVSNRIKAAQKSPVHGFGNETVFVSNDKCYSFVSKDLLSEARPIRDVFCKPLYKKFFFESDWRRLSEFYQLDSGKTKYFIPKRFVKSDDFNLWNRLVLEHRTCLGIIEIAIDRLSATTTPIPNDDASAFLKSILCLFNGIELVNTNQFNSLLNFVQNDGYKPVHFNSIPPVLNTITDFVVQDSNGELLGVETKDVHFKSSVSDYQFDYCRGGSGIRQIWGSKGIVSSLSTTNPYPSQQLALVFNLSSDNWSKFERISKFGNINFDCFDTFGSLVLCQRSVEGKSHTDTNRFRLTVVLKKNVKNLCEKDPTLTVIDTINDMPSSCTFRFKLKSQPNRFVIFQKSKTRDGWYNVKSGDGYRQNPSLINKKPVLDDGFVLSFSESFSDTESLS